MKKDPAIFLAHILESIDLIEDYSKNVTKTKFLKDRSLQDAIIRRLEIIREAVKNLSPTFRAKHPGIPWKKIAGMRDILIHEYFSVDLSLTWKVVKDDLVAIKKELSKIVITE